VTSVTRSHAASNHPTPTIGIKVVGIRFIEHPTVRASIDIQVGHYLTLRGFLVTQRPGQLPRVSLPSRERRAADGTRAYDHIVDMDEPMLGRVRKLILTAYANAERAKGGEQ